MRLLKQGNMLKVFNKALRRSYCIAYTWTSMM